LRNPLKSFEILRSGLKDVQYVKSAGRLALYQRLTKMAKTKRYQNTLVVDELKSLCAAEKFEFLEAPIREIEGTILHSEFIHGRKNIFIQNFTKDSNNDQDNNNISKNISVTNRYNISVEQVALEFYTRNLEFENGKHAETNTLKTLYGLLFWDIIFDSSIPNVFVDRYVK
jgi:hypothetical protein